MSDTSRPSPARDLPPAPYPGLDLRRNNGYASTSGRDNDLKLGEYWNIVRKRRWTIITVLVVVVTLSALFSLRTTPTYEATGRIAIFRDVPVTLSKDSRQENVDDDYSIDVDTQVRILQSDTLALDVARRAHLESNPLAVGSSSTESTSGLATTDIPAQLQPALLAFMHRNLRVLPVAKTRIVELRFASSDPKLAAEIVNATAAAYIEQNFRARYDATVQTSDWLSHQLADLQVRAETAQEKLVKFQKENGIVEIGDKQDVVTSKLDDLNKELTSAEADRIHKEAVYRMADFGAAHGEANTLADKLREKQADLRTQFAQLDSQFGPNYPKVLELKSEIEEVGRSLQAEEKRNTTKAHNDYLAALEREKLLRNAFDDQKNQASQLNERSVQFGILKRDVETSRTLYESLLEKLKEAGVLASLKSSNVHIVDSARVPTHPSSPNISQNLQLAFGGGLFAGVLFAFVLEGLDNTVRTPEQMNAVSGLSSLGIIPLDAPRRLGATSRLLGSARNQAGDPSGAADVALITSTEPDCAIAESYRALRTSILLSSPQLAPKVILISSSLPEEGKTTTCINTAIVLAQKNARVLLIDADLRRPSIHRRLGWEEGQGLSSILSGACCVEDALFSMNASPNLFVIPAGPIPPSPSELLSSAAMRELLEQCRKQFDHVVIDTPPVLSVTDAALLSAEVDSCLLVVRAARTTKAALRRTRDLFQQVNARVMGAVLNAVDLENQDAYYYTYHYYGQRDHSPYRNQRTHPSHARSNANETDAARTNA
jgi:exopolysaccharide transport family protein